MIEFNLENKQIIKLDLVEIVDNYKVLHFDEFPILYIGTNKFNNKIIGSHLEEDDDNQSIYTLHTILTNKEYHQFLNRKISYLNLLQNSNSISIVKKDFSFKLKKCYDIKFSDIPEDYVPTAESYCPKLVKSHSYQFCISLKGKLADLNKAIAEEVSIIQNGFTDFLEDRIKSLKGFDLAPKATLQPYSEGSFKINFELNFNHKGKKGNLFLNQAPIEEYISKYLNYLSEDFSVDSDVFKNENVPFSQKLEELEDMLEEVYETALIKKPDDLTSFLKIDILKSASKFEKITEQIGENFESASIFNISENQENSLAFIDREFSENFQKSMDEIEIAVKGTTVDVDFKEYKIYIYHLNTDNRAGNAFIKNIDNPEEMSKPKIKINGEEGLDQTKFTESLYLNKWISVNAKAKKNGEKFKSLEIQFD